MNPMTFEVGYSQLNVELRPSVFTRNSKEFNLFLFINKI